MVQSEKMWKRLLGTLVDQLLKTVFKVSRLCRRAEKKVWSQSAIKKILIIRLDNLGDVVLATAIFPVVRKKFPEALITVMVRHGAREVLQGNPHIDEIICHDIPWNKERMSLKERVNNFVDNLSYPKKLLGIVRYLRKQQYDLAIELRGEFRNILLFTYLAKAKWRVSYNKTGGEYLLTHFTEFEPGLHEIEKNYKLLRLLGISDETGKTRKMMIFPGPRDQEKVDAFLAGLKERNVSGKLIAIHPGGKAIQRWEPAKFGQLAEILKEKYQATILITGIKSEIPIINDVIKNMKFHPQVIAGKFKVKEFAYFLTKIHLLICNDTGVLHIASAMDSQTLAIFGPTNPKVFGHKNIRTVQTKLPCLAINHETCQISQGKPGECIKRIEVCDVINEVESLLAESHKAGKIG